MELNKIMTAREAIDKYIKDGDTVLIDVFSVCGGAEEVLLEMENSFKETGHPCNLTTFGASYGNAKGRGMDHLAHEGLVKKVIAGYFAMNRNLGKLVMDNKIEAYLYPLGTLSQIFREQAAGHPGLITQIGLDTFIDPRNEGCGLNDISKDQMNEVITIDGKEWLFFHAVPADVTIIRGTTADEFGNITYEREVGYYNCISAAQAAKNNGGKVIAQVERVVAHGSLTPKDVKVPGILVDAIVVASPENHPMTWAMPYDPFFSGELRGPAQLKSGKPFRMTAKKIIGRRAAFELRPNQVVNLGVGAPEYVATVANEEGVGDWFTLTVEDGIVGGIPGHGLSFGSSYNSEAVIDMPYQFDFYDGGGLDVTFVGLGQCDATGSVNVSKLGTRLPGVGGFLSVVQAKKAVFCGTFVNTPKGVETVHVKDGKLVIEGETEDVVKIKFVNNLIQKTFSGPYAYKTGQPLLYVTERCVFTISEEGLVLSEIAPGVDLEKDILRWMEFKPIISKDLKLMDPAIFQEPPMGVEKLRQYAE